MLLPTPAARRRPRSPWAPRRASSGGVPAPARHDPDAAQRRAALATGVPASRVGPDVRTLFGFPPDHFLVGWGLPAKASARIGPMGRACPLLHMRGVVGSAGVVEADPAPAAQPRRPRQPSCRSPDDAAPARGRVHPCRADADAVQQEGSRQAARDGADDAGREAPPPQPRRSLGLAAPLERESTVRAGICAARSPGRFGACSVAKPKLWPVGAAPRSCPGTRCARRTWRASPTAGRCRAGSAARTAIRRCPAPRDREVVSTVLADRILSFDRGQRRPARGGRPVAGRDLSAVPAARLVRAGHAGHASS